ncbi:tetratricopeptide repeat protein [Pseudomonas citronellolis]|uniref:tetratricopeptide repeat protein n=1 Tax=Pseudomonas citronellolis TaxID=53408 RepID=UPI002FD92FFA
MRLLYAIPTLLMASSATFASSPTEKLSNPSGATQKYIISIHAPEADGTQRLVIRTSDSDHVLIDSTTILSLIPSKSPFGGHDGFMLRTSSNQKGSLFLIDNQSETLEIPQATKDPIDKIVLITEEEENTQNNFNLVYDYKDDTKDFVLNALYSVQNNSQCDQSATAIYKIASPSIEKTLSKFDGTETFERLKTIRKQLNSNESYGEKILTNQTLSIYENAMKEYKLRNKGKLKEIVSSLIESGGDSETCPPESYIISKYYLPQDLTFSNNLGFLFEQTGHYAEAITLLRKVSQDNPQRTVAYLNLADSYWGAENHASAKENYLHYVELMRSAGKGGKIPSRIFDRTQ